MRYGLIVKVSVVIPSLNQAEFLEQAILSVVEQKGVDVEVIVIDGGSTDGSVEVIRRRAPQLAHWVSEPDSGQSEAINKGWARASGEVLCWLNADDYYLPGALATAAGYLASAPDVGVVYGDCIVVDRHGTVTGRQAPRPFDAVTYATGCNNYIPSGSTFLRAETVGLVGSLDEECHYLMDQDYWLRCSLVTTLRAIPDALSCFRVYPEAKTWSGEGKRAEEISRILCRFAHRGDLPTELLRQRARICARAHVGSAAHYLEAGETKRFLLELLASVRSKPLSCVRSRLRVLRSAAHRVPLAVTNRGGG